MSNPKSLKPFKKGYDSRRNVKGRGPAIDNQKELGILLRARMNEANTRNKTKLEKQLSTLDKSWQGIKLQWEYGYGKSPSQIGLNEEIIKDFALPVDVIAPSFFNAFRDIKNGSHLEYVFSGGRGSTKSSFVSLAIIYLIINNPLINSVIMRQVGETLRSSVFTQMQWAIDVLGLYDLFHPTTTPMEIEYIPTGQRIYFRGADDPGKIKSIKTPHGYIGILWLEELDQFKGLEAVRKIEQSIIRGGDKAFIFKSFNPPPTANNWANKYLLVPKDNRFIHLSNYLDVPLEWLGKPFVDEADWLRQNNPKAYEHEYLGHAVNSDSIVFDNLEVRQITNEEIRQFDNILMGVDWGFYPHPYAWVKLHYDATRRILYLFDEYRVKKASDQQTHDYLVKYKHVEPGDVLIADSEDPKAIGNYRAYGFNCRAAMKGPESVRASFEWLQGLTKIVIDPVRCPESSQEFLDYEYERDPRTDEIISGYPRERDDSIAAVRYATNLIWKQRGE